MRLLPVFLLLACNPPVTADETGDTGAEDSDTTPQPFAFYTPSWADGGAIPAEFTCDGTGGWQGQPNPELVWENPPEGTAAYAVLYVDSDLGDWEHWAFYTTDAAVAGIPASTSNTGSLPAGVVELNGQDGRTGYIPNCPSGQTHTYTFTIYAVNDASALTGQTTFSGLESAAAAAALATLSFSGQSDAG